MILALITYLEILQILMTVGILEHFDYFVEEKLTKQQRRLIILLPTFYILQSFIEETIKLYNDKTGTIND